MTQPAPTLANPPLARLDRDYRIPSACGKCGYDLTAVVEDTTMVPCPECGVVAPPICSGNESPWPASWKLAFMVTWPGLSLSLIWFMSLYRPPKDAGFVGPATIVMLRWICIGLMLWWPWVYGATLAWRHVPAHQQRTAKWQLRVSIYIACGVVLLAGNWLGAWIFENV